MPIGRRNLTSNSQGAFIVPNATASGAVRAGATVAVVELLGAVKVIECSSSSNAASFIGFANQTAADGDVVEIISIRGSTITPIVEGGGTLTAGDMVFISDTAGEVKMGVPTTGMAIRVGAAISATQLILTTDFQVVL